MEKNVIKQQVFSYEESANEHRAKNLQTCLFQTPYFFANMIDRTEFFYR